MINKNIELDKIDFDNLKEDIIISDKKNYYDMELGFTHGDYVAEYVKKVDEVNGECQNIYKKGKLNL